MAKKKLAIASGIIVGVLIIVNIIFSYVVAEPDTATKKRCLYSLHRTAVALVEYCNINDTTLTPTDLQVLVDEGVFEAEWLHCSEFGPQFGYFGPFDLLGPRPPLVLWCKSGHTADLAGFPVTVTYAINGRFKAVRYTKGAFEEELEDIETIREILACENSGGDIEMLLTHAAPSDSTTIRLFAIWKLGRMRSKDLEDDLLALLDDDKAAVHYEAAEALALLGNPTGGAALLARLRDGDYFNRLRAFNALKEFAGEDFGFNPVLDPQSQPAAMAGFDAWWARTKKIMRKEEGPTQKK